MNIKKITLLTLITLCMTGCISPKSYVDPSFSKATYNDINSVSEKHATKVVVEFQRNGKTIESVNKEVRGHVERTLRATGIVSLTQQAAGVSVKVVVNNVADMSDAAAKGFGVGLTFGAIGTLVTDYYEIKIELDDGKGTKLTENYKHALHTTIGNKGAPFQNVEPTTISDGFGTIVEQTILNFIKDVQAKGLLSLDAIQLPNYG